MTYFKLLIEEYGTLVWKTEIGDWHCLGALSIATQSSLLEHFEKRTKIGIYEAAETSLPLDWEVGQPNSPK